MPSRLAIRHLLDRQLQVRHLRVRHLRLRHLRLWNRRSAARRLDIALTVLLCATLLAGCVPAATPSPADPRSGGGLRYGLAPRPDQGVTFRTDVVLVQGGASSVRGVTADGLTWTLSPTAPGIGDLALGRVLFLTDRAVGTVRAIRTTSAGVEVTLSPAALTDVIEKGTFTSAKPIPLQQPVALSNAGAFWADPDLQRQAGAQLTDDSALDEETAFRSPLASGPSVPRPPAAAAAVANAATTQTGGFTVDQHCCGTGPKLNLRYDEGGLELRGQAQLAMQAPKADFFLEISGATVRFARLLLYGGHAGVNAHLDAATTPGKHISGWSPPLGDSVSFDVPLGVYAGVPLHMTVTQTLGVRLNIPGDAALHVTGRLDLGATLGFRYDGTKWENLSAGRFDADSAIRGTDSIAVGISYATFVYVIRLTVGIGAAGFTVGPFVSMRTSFSGIVGAPNGLNIVPGGDAAEQCRTVKGTLDFQFGVGYSIPAFVKKVIDFVLKVFNSEPIARHGGVESTWRRFGALNDTRPKSGFCVKK